MNKQGTKVLIFEHLNPDWILSDVHKDIYDKVYIHLKSLEYPPISVIAEQIDDKKIRQKLIDLTFDLEKFEPTYEMAVDCLVRIEQTIIKNKIDSLREKLRDADDNMDILSQLSNLEKDTNDIALKYANK